MTTEYFFIGINYFWTATFRQGYFSLWLLLMKPREWSETQKGLIKVGSAIYDLPQIVISQLCVSQIADKKTDKWVLNPLYSTDKQKIHFDEISKLEFKKSKLCLQSKKGNQHLRINKIYWTLSIWKTTACGALVQARVWFWYDSCIAWNLKNHKNSIIRLSVVRIQFWKKVVVELVCFRPNIYLSISTSWVRSSRNRDSFFISKFLNLISRASDLRSRYW